MQEFLRIFSAKMILIIAVVSVAAAFIFYQNNEKVAVDQELYSSKKVYAYLDILFDEYRAGCVDKDEERAATDAIAGLKRIKDIAIWEELKQTDYEEYVLNNYEQRIDNFKKQFPEIYQRYESLKSDHPERIKEYIEDAKEIELARSIFTERLNYAKDYRDVIEQGIRQGDKMIKSPLYIEKNTFGHMNILKSKHEYRQLLGVEVKPDNSKAFESIIQSSMYVNIFILVVVLVCIFRFYEERKNGLWQIVFTGAAGRGRLSLSRVISLFCVCAVTTTVVYGFISAAAFAIYGGVSDMGGLIQNSEQYRTYKVIADKWTMLALFWLVTVLGIFMVGMVMWAIMSAIHTNSLGMAAVGATLTAGYMLYRFIPVKSVFNVFKYVNIWSGVYSGEMFFHYSNWGYGGFITDSAQTLTVLMMFVAPAAIGIVFLINSRKKPVMAPGRLEKLVVKISSMFRKLVAKLPCFVQELYKILISQKAVVLLALLVIIAIINVEKRGYIMNSSMSVALEYYDEAEGLQLGEELSNIVDKYENEYHVISKQMSDIKESIANRDGVYTEDDLDALKPKYTLYTNAVREISRNIEHMKHMQAKGMNITVQNPFETEAVLSKDLYKNQRLYSLMAVIGAMVVSFGFFSYEKKCNMTVLIHTSKKGRARWFIRKVLSMECIVVVLWLILSILNWNNIARLYHINDYEVLIQSYPVMADYPLAVSKGMFFAMMYVWKLVMMIAVTWITMLFSAILDYIKSLLAVAVMLVPHLMLELGFEYFYRFSVVMPLCCTENYHVIGNELYGYLYGVILLLIAVISFIATYRIGIVKESE